jgi:hypothetical protein
MGFGSSGLLGIVRVQAGVNKAEVRFYPAGQIWLVGSS